MSDLKDIILGVIASIIVVIIVWLIKPLLKVFQSIKTSFQIKRKLGIVRIYRKRDKAIDSIFQDLLDTKIIKTLNYKGYSLLDSNNRIDTKLYKLATDTNSKVEQVHFLLLNPNSSKYIQARIDELKILTDNKSVKNDITHSVDMINHINKTKTKIKSDYKFFDEALKWNLLISNKYILIGFYRKKEVATRDITICALRESILGYAFEKYFNDIWENKSIKENNGI